MPNRRKIAITVADDIYREAEKLRRTTGESRSAVYERAVAELLTQRRRIQARGAYVDGYQKAPESKVEVDTARATARVALSAIEWDEEG